MFYDGGSKLTVTLIDEGENGSLKTDINHDNVTAYVVTTLTGHM